jgi:hypothetical protein
MRYSRMETALSTATALPVFSQVIAVVNPEVGA